MPSAYDISGRLKKNALLGTSLAVDPYRKAEKQQFEGLQKEAIGKTQEEMSGILQDRWQRYGQPQANRLAEIAQQKQSILDEASNLRNSESEYRFSAYDKWISRPDLIKAVDKGKVTLAGAGVPKDFLAEAKAQYNKMTAREKADYAKQHNIKQGLTRFTKSVWEEKYGTPQQQAYNEMISNEVDKIQGRIQPLQEEEMARQERLANRAELYNMFLGTY